MFFYIFFRHGKLGHIMFVEVYVSVCCTGVCLCVFMSWAYICPIWIDFWQTHLAVKGWNNRLAFDVLQANVSCSRCGA